jgi:hypothetical protein
MEIPDFFYMRRWGRWENRDHVSKRVLSEITPDLNSRVNQNTLRCETYCSDPKLNLDCFSVAMIDTITNIYIVCCSIIMNPSEKSFG